MSKHHIEKYIKLRPIYKKLAESVAQLIEEVLLINNINYHIVNSRAKTIESFSAKIAKPKYDDPFSQLTDLAGVRIIGYVEDDVKFISELVQKLFKIDSENSLDKSQELGIDRVGYKSVHYVCELPPNRIELPEYKRYEGLKFEIQIRTILQHSWAEIEHDKNYKFAGELPSEIQRRFKLLAGNLEIVDREFNLLSREIDTYNNNVKVHTEKGELDIPINSTSIKQFLKTKFKKSIKMNVIRPNVTGSSSELSAITELRNFGITTLEQLNNIIPQKFEQSFIKHKENSNFLGLVRSILLINDVDKYFNQSWENDWGRLGQNAIKVLEEYSVDIDKVVNYLKNYS